MLSKPQTSRYEDQGYLVLDRLIPKSDLAAIRQAAVGIVDEFDVRRHNTVFSTRDGDKGRDTYFMESAEAVHCFLEEDALDTNGNLNKPKHLAVNKIGHAMHDLVPEFTAFCRKAVFGEILRDIGYRAPMLWQSMYIFKQPQIGGEVRWHQDATYLGTDPPAVTGFWVAVEDAHMGNGCLWVQPAGHKSPVREIFEVDRDSLQGELRVLDETPWPTESDAQALEVPAGSLVIFSDCMPHYSSQNFSDTSRHAFTMHFAEQSATWLEANWLQRPRLGSFAV